MKRTLLFALAIAVIPVGVDAQVTPSASCADMTLGSPLKDLRTCAEQGNARAQASLAFKYSIGDGVPEDDAEAVRWFRLAADQGFANAQYNLGIMYDTGDGVPEDDAEAVRWYRPPSKGLRTPSTTSGLCTTLATAYRRTMCSPICGRISRRPKDMRMRRKFKTSSKSG